jgi:hypothetical protein
MILLSVLLEEQTIMVLLLKMSLVFWSSAMNEHGEHKNLCGSVHRGVTPYVHERMELYCPSQALPV